MIFRTLKQIMRTRKITAHHVKKTMKKWTSKKRLKKVPRKKKETKWPMSKIS